MGPGFRNVEAEKPERPHSDKFPLHLRTVSFRVAHIQLHAYSSSFLPFPLSSQITRFPVISHPSLPFLRQFRITRVPVRAWGLPAVSLQGPESSSPRAQRRVFSRGENRGARGFLFECALLRELGVELHMRVCVCVVWSSSHERRDVRRDRFQCF